MRDISAVSDLNESDFCQWLTREVGVAAIPLSAFLWRRLLDQRVVRFCFAKKMKPCAQRWSACASFEEHCQGNLMPLVL